MLVMDFLLPLIMVVFGKLFQHCPEEINSVFGYRPPVHGQSRGLELCPPRLRQTLVPLGSGAAAGDSGADAPGVGAGHRHRGPLPGAVVMVVQLAVLLLCLWRWWKTG